MNTTAELINTLWEKDTETLKSELLDIVASKSYIEGEFILKSGKKSNYYIDGKKTTLDAKGGVLISLIFLRLLKPDVNAVGGISVGADPISSGVSQIGYLLGKNIDAFYVRKEPKQHGTSKWIEGPMEKGKVTIVEDTVTTGGSSITAIDKVNEFGSSVEQVLAIVDRNQGGREAFSNKGLEYTFLFDIKEVIERSKTLS